MSKGMIFRRIRVISTKVQDEDSVEELRERLKEAEERAQVAEHVLQEFKKSNVTEILNVLVSKVIKALVSTKTLEIVDAEYYELLEEQSWADLSDEEKEFRLDCLREAIEYGIENMEVSADYEKSDEAYEIEEVSGEEGSSEGGPEDCSEEDEDDQRLN